MDHNFIKSLKQISVLYVEDEDELRQSVSEMLELLFKKVYLASDGIDALGVCTEENLDLIITDIKMPNMDGITFIKELRKKYDHTPIIIISAHTETGDILEAVELSLVSYIVKPITETKLMDVFKKFFLKINNTESYVLRDDWVIDFSKNIIISNEKNYSLTKKEKKMLQILVKNNFTISYEIIEQELWKSSYMSQNALRLFIKNLRKKLPPNALVNVQGIGYKLN